MLIAFSGLPGTGKSTIARLLAQRVGATWLRIDTIEQALRHCATLPNGVVTEGYAVAYQLARDNLRIGGTVIADSVNPLSMTRDAWQAVATETGAAFIEVETICSDPIEHRRRVESRATDIPGLKLPAWEHVQIREYHPWIRPHIVIDTAKRDPASCVNELVATVQGRDT